MSASFLLNSYFKKSFFLLNELFWWTNVFTKRSFNNKQNRRKMNDNFESVENRFVLKERNEKSRMSPSLPLSCFSLTPDEVSHISYILHLPFCLLYSPSPILFCSAECFLNLIFQFQENIFLKNHSNSKVKSNHLMYIIYLYAQFILYICFVWM